MKPAVVFCSHAGDGLFLDTNTEAWLPWQLARCVSAVEWKEVYSMYAIILTNVGRPKFIRRVSVSGVSGKGRGLRGIAQHFTLP